MDCFAAFLNEELSEEVYMSQAPGFETKDSRGRPLIMKLHKSMYGLWQSSKAWNGTFGGEVRTIGFLLTASDACVYVKGSLDTCEMLRLYVDNLLITGPNDNTVAKVRTILKDKFTTTLGTQLKSSGSTSSRTISAAPSASARVPTCYRYWISAALPTAIPCTHPTLATS